MVLFIFRYSWGAFLGLAPGWQRNLSAWCRDIVSPPPPMLIPILIISSLVWLRMKIAAPRRPWKDLLASSQRLLRAAAAPSAPRTPSVTISSPRLLRREAFAPFSPAAGRGQHPSVDADFALSSSGTGSGIRLRDNPVLAPLRVSRWGVSHLFSLRQSEITARWPLSGPHVEGIRLLSVADSVHTDVARSVIPCPARAVEALVVIPARLLVVEELASVRFTVRLACF